MGFSQKIKDEVMVKSARHCSSCRRFKGVKVEIHHIIPQSEGGEDSIENAIALCFDCHAEAGHYNVDHPKGTKYSKSELKLAREKLYADVDVGNIQSPDNYHDDLYLSFLIGKNKEEVAEILRGDLSSIPLEDCLFWGTDIAKHIMAILELENTSVFESVEDSVYKSLHDFIKAHPEAIAIDKSSADTPYFDFKRVPSRDELLSGFFQINKFIKRLLDNGVDPKHLCRIFTKKDLISVDDFNDVKDINDEENQELDGCGSPISKREIKYEEIYKDFDQISSNWYIFIRINNISESLVRLSEMKLLSRNDEVFRKFNDDSGSEQVDIKLPSVSLLPGQSVIIPLGFVLPPSVNLDVVETSVFSKYDDLFPVHFNITRGYDDHLDQFYTCGLLLKPLTISYTTHNENRRMNIHTLDLNNLYSWIYQDWDMGCCPHLFLITDTNRITYEGALFVTRPGQRCEETILIPGNIKGIVISEIEDETTFIENLSINGISVASDIKLNKGDRFNLPVKKGDCLEVVGRYISKGRRIPPDALFIRQELISNFMFDFYRLTK